MSTKKRIPIDLGKEVKVINANVYPTYSTNKVSETITGTYYIYFNQIVNDRVRVTDKLENITSHCSATGWINTSDILKENKEDE